MGRDEYEVSLEDLLARRRARSTAAMWFWAAAAALVLGIVALACVANADERDVPSAARREIAMRGEQIEHVSGQVRASDDENLIAQAAETPADDSGKWHLTILTIGNCQACDRLKRDLRSEAFRDWVDLDDHRASHLHFHELRYDGDVGREWGRKLEKFLGRKIAEFPTIIVQPPVDGSFGKHTEIAYMQSGYDGDPDKLTAAMAQGLGKYIARLSERRMLARRDGHRQDETDELGATPPPFSLAPTNPPATPGLTFPQTLIPPRLSATVEQIKAACQGCDAEFLLAQISKGATIEEAAQAWQQVSLLKQIEELRKLKDQASKPQADPVTPKPAAPAGFSWVTLITTLVTLLGGGGLGSLVTWGLTAFRNARKASGKPTLINDPAFAELIALLKSVLNQKAPAAP